MLLVGCCLLVECLSFVVFLLRGVCRVCELVVWCELFGVCCLLFVVCCLLLLVDVVRGLLCAVCCLWHFVVCCCVV